MLINAHDPYVLKWTETGITPFSNLTEALAIEPDIAVISTGHRMYQDSKTIEAFLVCKPMWIYDTIGILRDEQITKLQQKHKVIILGRGDL
jgi:hypothetical protein